MTTIALNTVDRIGHAASPPEVEADIRFQQFALQVLSLLLYGGFAIVATVLAFVNFWPAGVVLALFLAWRGFAPVGKSRGEAAVAQAIGQVIPVSESVRKSGNASFDAYRTELMTRLEDEQRNFENFLTRLRDAKDEREFDNFMDDRARKASNPDFASNNGDYPAA